ncbi:MAG TPA: hypothetical protein VK484_08645 [Ferruginibacter sp.]|nr:hypothetical protein [Ferruginibacter sp.]
MRYHSYLNSAKKIIGSYNGEMPLSFFLKKYFSAEKKYGSKDRKQISALCYNYYRLGKAMPDVPLEEKIITATFLCENGFNDFLNFHKPRWNELITKPLTEKIYIAGLEVEDIFPKAAELSEGIGLHSFCSSFLLQPDLFIRIRPGKKNGVIEKLEGAGIPVTMQGEDCAAFPNSTKLDTVLDLDKDAVVQDHNSQKVLNFLKDPAISNPLSAWDCCAASGGKSILLYDMVRGEIELTVSDIRESILSNLKKRFLVAGIKKYKSFIADLSAESPPLQDKKYSLIICDAPCTGSGTWSRTPEQLYYFKPPMTDAYAEKQKKIISNTVPQLQEGGLFFYITCSVFKKENEEQVNYIKEKFHLQLLQLEFLKGFDKKADNMFVAVFMKK